ncbi:unnamed protein product [Oreochromis niloticus]|nr:unnamed protein product [Mustela putorius furo]
MTMMMTSSQFGQEDMEALLWGPSSPMADAMDSLFFRPDKEQQKGGGSLEGDAEPASPLTSSSLSSSSSPPPFYSPPPSPPALLLHGDKVGMESDLLSFPLLGHPGQLRCSQALSGDGKEDVLSDLDWMAEKVDLSDLDLDSLIGSCSPAVESHSSPEDLLASFDCPMELDSLPLPALSTPVLMNPPSASLSSIPAPSSSTVCSDTTVITVDDPESCIDGQEVPSSPLCIPEPQEELEIKSEPTSPDPESPVVESPSSPTFTLDLGSEVDVSKVLCCSPPSSPPKTPSRSRPYPEPNYKASPPSPSTTSVKIKSPRGAGGPERAGLRLPRDKKQKKMEQNKTAATRYRQKKRAEKDSLAEEHVLLERKNVELTEKAESMAREIEYLKELMEEVRMARLKKGLSADP